MYEELGEGNLNEELQWHVRRLQRTKNLALHKDEWKHRTNKDNSKWMGLDLDEISMIRRLC